MPSLTIVFPPSVNSTAKQFVSLELESSDEFFAHLRDKLCQSRKPLGCGEPVVEASVSDVDHVDEASQEALDDANEEDKGIARNRLETLEILEGKRKPTPDRDYPDKFAIVFRVIEVEEKIMATRRAARRTYKGPAPILRGWKFLHNKLFGDSANTKASGILPWDPRQRAYLMRLRKANGRWVVEAARNINACSVNRLLELMKDIEDRGFVDVIRVVYPCSLLETQFPDEDLEGARAITWCTKCLKWHVPRG